MEHVNYPGHAASLLGFASYSSDYHRGYGLAQGWYPVLQLLIIMDFLCVNSLMRLPNPNGIFNQVLIQKL